MQISVIIPIYNKIEIIQHCISLNIKHSKTACHWILIDNNSDLKTKKGLLELKNEAESLHHFCTIITETTNTGVAIAWNKGIEIAKTDYVCILNNDCVMMPNWDLELLEFDKKNILDIYSPFVLETNILKSYTLETFLNGKNSYKSYLQMNKNRIRNGTFGGVVIFGKKNNFEIAGKFDEKLWISMEDMDFLWAAIQKGLKVGITGSAIAFHYVSVTRKEIIYDYSNNQTIFLQKWHWNFELNENTFLNKLIKSWNKFLLRSFKILGSINPFMP